MHTEEVAGRPYLTFLPRMEEHIEGLPSQASLPLPGRSCAGPGDWSQQGTQPSPGTPECRCCRTKTTPWSTMVTLRRILIERGLYALYSSLSFPASPPQPVAPPPWPLASPATLLFPPPLIQLVTLPSLLAPELCSDACAGPGLLTFPRMATLLPPWSLITFPTQPRWSLNCHVPVQHRPAFPSGPKTDTGLGPQDLPPDTHTASSLIPVSPPRLLHLPAHIAGSLSLCCLFSWAGPRGAYTSPSHPLLPPSAGSRLWS